MIKLLILEIILSFVAGVDSNGCWNEIPNTAVESITGSTGFTVECTTTTIPETSPASHMMTHVKESPRRIGRGPFRQFPISRESSFLEGLSEPVQVCIQSTSGSLDDSTPGYVDIKLFSQYVIRGAAIYDSSQAGYVTPSSFTMNVRSGEDMDEADATESKTR